VRLHILNSCLFFRYPLQQIQAQTIVVIHPGSLYLRIGRASDLNPHTLLHVVARRRLPSGSVHHDTFLPKQVPKVGSVSTVCGKWLEAVSGFFILLQCYICTVLV
jgi:hypothetical protein